MALRKIVTVFFFAWGCLLSGLSAGESPRVTFINPDKPGNAFWDSVTTFMQAAADDLDIRLSVRYGMANRQLTTGEALDALATIPKPDYLIFIYQKGQGSRILQAAEHSQVQTFIINTEIPPEEQDAVGRPGAVFTKWIGHLAPDDFQVGHDLASLLIRFAQEKFPDKPLEMVGFTGGRDSSAARLRNQGLEAAVKEFTGVKLRQVLVAEWDPDVAAEQAPRLFRRYPRASIVWAASDAMALAAADSLAQEGFQPGESVFFGGVDWTPAGIQAVDDNYLVATFGGHFMDGGWALVLLHDHFHGLSKAEAWSKLQSRLLPVTSANADRYLTLFGGNNWDAIDFRRFSSRNRAADQSYDFGLEAVLNAAGKNSDATELRTISE